MRMFTGLQQSSSGVGGALGRSRAALDLSVAFAPHKMRLTGEELETAAPGANGRADVLLLAWPTDAAVPTVLGWVYHTTNVSPGTASHRPEQVL